MLHQKLFLLRQGYVVEAIDKIEKDTFICEYSGRVDINRNNTDLENDSIFTLYNAGNPRKALEIVPNVISNIARFISGINNDTMVEMQNVASYRRKIDGIPHIILKAIRDIEKDETLYYDYNEGDKLSRPYDTSSFNDDSVLVYGSKHSDDDKMNRKIRKDTPLINMIKDIKVNHKLKLSNEHKIDKLEKVIKVEQINQNHNINKEAKDAFFNSLKRPTKKEKIINIKSLKSNNNSYSWNKNIDINRLTKFNEMIYFEGVGSGRKLNNDNTVPQLRVQNYLNNKRKNNNKH